MPSGNIRLMEVCGTHTHNFLRFGLDKLLPAQLKFISGPGCPVCVSSKEYIDRALIYANMKDTIIATYGDMLKVPGSDSSLDRERTRGADIRILYSALDNIRIAHDNPSKKIIFLAVGFETTAPTVALTVLRAKKERIKNLFFLTSLKIIPAAMSALLGEDKLNIQGFLCPGHVSAIIGVRPYRFIPEKFKIACCIAGFEPLDILQGIYFLLKQIKHNCPKVDNQYARVVKINGNSKAKFLINNIFKVIDTSWRGLGTLSVSGLQIRNRFARFDAEYNFPIRYKPAVENLRQKQCRCAEVLKGLIGPEECPLFSKLCTPDNPFGPCMVSNEGSCNAYYRYKKIK